VRIQTAKRIDASTWALGTQDVPDMNNITGGEASLVRERGLSKMGRKNDKGSNGVSKTTVAVLQLWFVVLFVGGEASLSG
jgi:hypothetical protein